MTDPLLEPEHAQFLDSVRSFVDAEIVPHATAWDLEERYPQELFKEFGRLGWLGVAVPESYGGSGGGSVLYALLCAETRPRIRGDRTRVLRPYRARQFSARASGR